jgi:hypothetical protein
MAALLLLAKTMFPEGQQRVQAVRKDGAAAPLVNALIVNAKDAIDELWKARGNELHGVRRPPRRGGAKVVVCRLCDILTDLRVRSPAATVPAGRVDQCTIRDRQGAMQRCARPLRTHALIRTSVGAAC